MEIKKPACSYGISCFRKNPFHFKQCSHAHLEQLLLKIPGKEIVLPDDLGFHCGDKSLLREQLEVLRTVQAEKNDSETNANKRKANDVQETAATKSNSLQATASGSQVSSDSHQPKKLKDDSKRSPVKRCIERSKRIRDEALKRMRASGAMPEYVAPMGDFALKWVLAAPYHLFFTTVPKIQATWNQNLNITFSEILDVSLGDIEESLHSSMVVDFQWLIAQYMIAGQDVQPKMTVFYDSRSDEDFTPNWIQAHVVKCPDNYGTHHSKISIFRYTNNGIRIVISTANLYSDDWDARTQGIWISPHLERMPDTAKVTDGESPTGFKADFLHYLAQYGLNMQYWKHIVSRADCSSINVAFFASVPGSFSVQDTSWGFKKLGALLLRHAKTPNVPTTIIAQASSMGSLGINRYPWLYNQIVAAMSKTQADKKETVNFKLIWPTVQNYLQSLDMQQLSNCLCNSQHHKQQWIEEFMCVWKADKTCRTRAIPHIKSYTRISEDNKRIWWFAVTSANLSKAAWGHQFTEKYRILSYETGIVFFPKFLTGEDDFSVSEDSTRSSPVFPMPYDLPLANYTSTDQAFTDNFFKNP